MSDEETIVALSMAVALSGNAHTRLYLLRNRTELRRLPVLVYWFNDGLFVVRATATLRDTLGCRATGIAGLDPQTVRGQVAQLFAGNASWVERKAPISSIGRKRSRCFAAILRGKSTRCRCFDTPACTLDYR